MKPPAVIILSKTRSNLEACVRAVRAHEAKIGHALESPIVIVDDFPQEVDGGHPLADCGGYLAMNSDGLLWCQGVKPFVFARNANIGIRAAGARDVILLNDDALLATLDGFTLLQQAAAQCPEYGLIAATCNNVGNPNQRPQGTGLLREDAMACFIAVLIPRRTIRYVGLLDERFVHYGWEDNDYCRRVRLAGLKIGIHDGCYVDHGSLVSTFRGQPGAGGDIGPNGQIYRDKWARA